MPPSAEEVALKHRIDELYTAYPFYGGRRIAAQLRREGMAANRKAVQRHMGEMGIAGIAPGPNTSRRVLAHRIHPYLLGSVASAYPDHVWGIDITYIRLQGGWMYLVAVLDWYSRAARWLSHGDGVSLVVGLVTINRKLPHAAARRRVRHA